MSASPRKPMAAAFADPQNYYSVLGILFALYSIYIEFTKR